MQLGEHGAFKYGGDTDLFATSAAIGWRGLAVEHRRHPKSVIPSFKPQHMEVCIVTGSHPDCVISRTGDRIRQRSRVEPGSIWLCPVGVLEEDIEISAWHDTLQVYMPPERFARLSDDRGGAAARPEAVRYLGGVYDERIRRIGARLLAELCAPSAGGALLIDILALRLTEYLIDTHSSDVPQRGTGDQHRLDDRRLRKVLDYMAAHVEDDVRLDDLAGAACLSAFHFSRVFASTMGMPPHRYLGHLRLERAKTLLALRRSSIADVALATNFSSQSNFTRAFRRATGVTPLAYAGRRDEQ